MMGKGRSARKADDLDVSQPYGSLRPVNSDSFPLPFSCSVQGGLATG
jgi:hypothetical protein